MAYKPRPSSPSVWLNESLAEYYHFSSKSHILTKEDTKEGVTKHKEEKAKAFIQWRLHPMETPSMTSTSISSSFFLFRFHVH